MKIAISGGNGFIGSSLIKYLSNFEIVAIKRNNINIGKEINLVIHLAGLAHDMSARYTLDDYMISNYELTKKIYRKFSDSNASVFIFVSSSKVYGESGIFNEKSLVNPQTNYAKSKLKAENYLLNKINAGSKNIIILRPSLIYSNFDSMKGNLNLLKKLIRKLPIIIFPNIQQKRSYCSLENFYDLIRYLEFNNLDSGIYNFSDSDSVSTFNIVKNMSKNKIFISLNKHVSLLIYKISMKMPFINKIFGKLFNEFIIENFKIKRLTGLSFEKKIN